MAAPQWEDVRRVFIAALDLPDPRRAGFVREECRGDDVLCAEVEALLRQHDAEPLSVADDFSPAGVVAGHVGPYRIIEKIGEGGFGMVYLAEQEHPVRRRVALKILKEGMDTRRIIARFEAERQALALMDHPCFARIYDAGATPTGRPYFSMELVNGPPITRYCDEHRLSPARRLELLIHVCHAVHHAHQKGVIHRDIKPSNVLVGEHDGEPAPKVIDFGVAKAVTQPLTERTIFTGLRQMIGTPAYMSPEQAEMTGTDVDTRADVYSLGVLTYELLTGTLPFDPGTLVHASPQEVQRVILETDPPKPSARLSGLGDKGREVAHRRGLEHHRLRTLLRGDLDRIVMKALAKDRRHRYGSAEALADDLRRYLDGLPVQASPPGVLYVIGKAARRHRVGFTVAAAVLLSLCGGLGLASWGFATARRERDTALEERNQKEAALLDADVARRLAEERQIRAEASADMARRAQHRAALAAARAAAESDNPAEAFQLLRDTPEELRGWEWAHLHRLLRPPGTLELPPQPFKPVACSPIPGGSLLVISTAGAGTRALIWDGGTGNILRTLDAASVVPDPTGDMVVGLTPLGELALFRAADGSIARAWPPESGSFWKLGTAPFIDEGAGLVVQDGPEWIACLSTRTGEVRWRRRLVGTVVSPPSVVSVAGLGEPQAVRVLSHGRGGRHSYFTASAGEPLHDDTHRDVRNYVELYNNRWTRVRPDGTKHNDPPRPGGTVYSARSVAGDLIALGDTRGTVVVYQDHPASAGTPGSRTVSRLATLRVGSGAVRSLAFTDNRTRVCVVTSAGECLSVPIAESSPQWRFEPVYRTWKWSPPSPDRSRLAMLSWGGVACLDPITGLPQWSVNTGSRINTAAAWSHDGRLIAIATEGAVSEFFVLDADTGRQVVAMSTSPAIPDPARPPAPPSWSGEIAAMQFSPADDRLFVAFADGSLRVVETRGWEAVASPRIERGPPHARAPVALALSENGKALAHLAPRSDAAPSALVLRESHTLREIAAADIPGAACLAWWPDDSAIVVGGNNGRLSCFNAADGSPRWSATAPTAESLSSVVVSPDGTRVMAAAKNPVVFVFDAGRGEYLASLTSIADASLSMGNDGAVVCAGNVGGLLRLESSDRAEPWSAAAPWPAGIPRPRTAWEARAMVLVATDLWSSHRRDWSLAARTEAVLADTRHSGDIRRLAAHIGQTFGVQVNWWNSNAVAVARDPQATQSRRKDAVVILREAVAAQPGRANLHANLGMALRREGEFAQALTHLQRSAALRAQAGLPPRPEIDAAGAECLFRIGRAEESLAVLRAAEQHFAAQGAADPNIAQALAQTRRVIDGTP